MPHHNSSFSNRRKWLFGVIGAALLAGSCTSKSEVSIPNTLATQAPVVVETPTVATSQNPAQNVVRGIVDCPIRSILAAVSKANAVASDTVETDAAAASSVVDADGRRLRPVVGCFDGAALVATPSKVTPGFSSPRDVWDVSYLSRTAGSSWTVVGKSASTTQWIDVVNVDKSITDPNSGSVVVDGGASDGPSDCQVLSDLYGNCEDGTAKVVSSRISSKVGSPSPIARVVVRSGNDDTRVFFTSISQSDCDPCAGGLGAASYGRSGAVWNPENKVPVVAQLGSDGSAPRPIVVWRSGWRTMAMYSSMDRASGATSETLTLLGFNGKFLIGFEDVLQSTKGAANCAPSGTIDCFSTQGDIEVVDSPAEPLSDFPTVVIRRSGTSPAGPIEGVTTYQFDSRQSRFLPKTA